MRKLLMVAMALGLCVGLSKEAAANYFFPGIVIIGGGGGGSGGGTGGGTTKSAPNSKAEKMAMAVDDCKLDKDVKCECFTDKPLLSACKATGVDIKCLTPTTPYKHVEQSEPVLAEGKDQLLGQLRCTGQSNMSAYVQLVVEGQDP